jgi:hypothetical protein
VAITNEDVKMVHGAVKAHHEVFPHNKVMNFRYFKDPDRRVQVFVHPPLSYTANLRIPPPPPDPTENPTDAPDAE